MITARYPLAVESNRARIMPPPGEGVGVCDLSQMHPIELNEAILWLTEDGLYGRLPINWSATWLLWHLDKSQKGKRLLHGQVIVTGLIENDHLTDIAERIDVLCDLVEMVEFNVNLNPGANEAH